MPPHLRVEQRQLALRLKARGLSLREIGAHVGCSYEQVRIIAGQAPRRPVRRDSWVPGPGRLTLEDREEISIGLRTGQSFTAIAARLEKAVSTVSREVAANGENTNGLLRQYLPKGTDLSIHSAEDLARIAASLNNRPRKTLGFMKPSEKLAELLAHTG